MAGYAIRKLNSSMQMRAGKDNPSKVHAGNAASSLRMILHLRAACQREELKRIS